jgi:hypothetical protein
VRVRMGLHTGEPAVGSEGYLGLDVVRAARLCTVGAGGHVLLSETTRSLVGGALPDGVSIFPLGERQLKDIDEPERVYELDIDGVETPQREPPAPATPAPPAPPGGDFTDRLTSRIDAHVRRTLEETFARFLPAVDALAERAARRPERIAERLEED